MDKIFLTILNMSLVGAFVILAVCIMRLPLKKAPKFISYCLWLVVGFKLVFPYSLESVFSLMPIKSAPIPLDIAMQPVPQIDSGIIVGDNIVNSFLPEATPATSVNPLQMWIEVGSYLWVAGVALMFVYGVVSYMRLKRRMKHAVHVEDNIYESHNMQSPFVLGFIKPKIYLPANLSSSEREFIIHHEQVHIQRHDHLVKPLAYCILCLHWFNPLAWLAFLLMGVDMEMSCDERVLKEMGNDTKKDYSLSLLSLAARRWQFAGSPLAFSEGGLKGRIKNVLKFKQPSRLALIVTVVLVAALSLGFIFSRDSSFDNPKSDPPESLYDKWEVTDGITLHLLQDSYPPGTKSLTLVLENRSDNVMLYGQGWSFEKYKNGQWYPVETKKNYGFTLEGYYLLEHDKNTFTISTLFLKKPLSSGTYRVTGCSLTVAKDVENLWGGGDNVDYPPYQLTFTVSKEAKPEPKPQPKQQLANWQLPDIEPWQWYTPWECYNMYDRAGLFATMYSVGGNGLVAILYSNKAYSYPTDLLMLDIIDRKTGKRYQVFTKPTVEVHSVTGFDQGFIIVTDNVYYCYLDDGGKLVMTPLK